MKWFRAADYYQRDAWRAERRCGAGVTIQHAFHYIDLLELLVGPAASVEAKMCNLSHPDVDVVLCGPANNEHVREACTALAKGPLDEEELAWMRRVGDHDYGRSPVAALAD